MLFVSKDNGKESIKQGVYWCLVWCQASHAFSKTSKSITYLIDLPMPRLQCGKVKVLKQELKFGSKTYFVQGKEKCNRPRVG